MMSLIKKFASEVWGCRLRGQLCDAQWIMTDMRILQYLNVVFLVDVVGCVLKKSLNSFI